ncbi:hypothetical protein F511_27865 [Dorcoceras hygrometricum]|uniref:Uncharacterized protein n=1 Tax=Dorcoceras hygrometricum TaxID=472368 RepID=A0A2Z7BTZ9_9LAMI|nr:hypothetical protein F511_27865 [Dorcoceras hygrometricum]
MISRWWRWSDASSFRRNSDVSLVGEIWSISHFRRQSGSTRKSTIAITRDMFQLWVKAGRCEREGSAGMPYVSMIALV